MPSSHWACATGSRQCAAAKREEGESDKEFADRPELHSRFCRIHHKIVVLSGRVASAKARWR